MVQLAKATISKGNAKCREETTKRNLDLQAVLLLVSEKERGRSREAA